MAIYSVNKSLNDYSTPDHEEGQPYFPPNGQYIVLGQAINNTLSLNPENILVNGDDDLKFPIVIMIPSQINPSEYSPFVIENEIKAAAKEDLDLETALLKGQIISYDLDGLGPDDLINVLKKIARLRQIELKLSTGDF